ncbi:MAG TPA: triose-phosphate isomerase [Cyanobacteria bacterium UBA8530]|nr:triose-phosphate isomerase [Cyanobacteria bacterium UBA8530]
MSNQKRVPVIAGNWKMYKNVNETRDFFRALPDSVRSCTDPMVVICPPFTDLHSAKENMGGSTLQLGAQNMHWQDEGAFTGEISPLMLRDIGCSHVLIGHSERRQYFGETDGTVNRKTLAALQWQLIPIVCVGEKLEEREAKLTDNVVIVQVQRALLNISKELIATIIFAYEPVWAIGTGKTCDSAEANRVCGIIRETVAMMSDKETAEQVRILYGGSVKPDSIKEQMSQPHIDGALVGGASLDPKSFSAIVNFR